MRRRSPALAPRDKAAVMGILERGGRIVTKVVPLNGFYRAEDYHQHYFDHNPNNPYIVYNDAPKVAHLHQEFPELYTGK